MAGTQSLSASGCPWPLRQTPAGFLHVQKVTNYMLLTKKTLQNYAWCTVFFKLM